MLSTMVECDSNTEKTRRRRRQAVSEPHVWVSVLAISPAKKSVKMTLRCNLVDFTVHRR